MNLNNQVSEIISSFNIDINNLNSKDINLTTNQVFCALYQVDNSVDFGLVYSSVINVITKLTKDEKTDDEIVNNFNRFRNQINRLDQVKHEHLENIKMLDNMSKDIMLEKAKHLKSLFQPEQRSPEWYAIRETLCTASQDTYDIIKGNQGKVILKKCGLGPSFFGNKYTWHGNKYEDIAIGIYESRYSRTVWEYGLIQHPTIEVLGASPDGITTCGRMLEIKCPSGRKINGHIKPVYFCQMQTQMEVCDLDVCDFFEANLIQYRNKQDYERDIYDAENIGYLDILPSTVDLKFIKVPDCRRASNGLEKGLIGSHGPHPGEMTHIFPPFHLSSIKQQQWMEDKVAEFAKNGVKLYVDYWWLETSSLNIVKRDRKWWADNKITEKLYDTWDKIHEARKTKNGTDKYLSKKKYNEKYNIDQGKTVDLTNLFGVEEKTTTPNTENELLDLNLGCLLDFSDDEFTIDEPKPKPKKVKKVKKSKKVKKVKIVKKKKKVIKKKKKKVVQDPDAIDDDLMSMMGCLCIDSDDD